MAKKHLLQTLPLILLLIVSSLWIYRELEWRKSVSEIKKESEFIQSVNENYYQQLVEQMLKNNNDSITAISISLKNRNEQLYNDLQKYTQQQSAKISNKNTDKSEIEQNKQKEKEANIGLNNKVNEPNASEKTVEKKNVPQTKYITFIGLNGQRIHYMGETSDGKANGFGTGIWENGNVYEGFWINNKKNGKGVFKWPDGESYTGEFKDDKRDGEGVYIWKNLEKYEGTWSGDFRSGYGTLYDKKGKVKLQGDWKEDVLIKKLKK